MKRFLHALSNLSFSYFCIAFVRREIAFQFLLFKLFNPLTPSYETVLLSILGVFINLIPYYIQKLIEYALCLYNFKRIILLKPRRYFLVSKLFLIISFARKIRIISFIRQNTYTYSLHTKC